MLILIIKISKNYNTVDIKTNNRINNNKNINPKLSIAKATINL